MGIRPEVEKLLKEGFDVNTRNAEGETALFSCRQPELYDLLVQYGADINLKNFKGESLLYRASFYGVSWIVDKLLADGVDLESRDHQQETALFASIYKLASAPVTQKLIEAGAKFQIVDAEGWTPLHLAASANNVRAAEILIGAGSSRNAVDQNGNSPISIAEQMGSAAVLKLLTGRPQSPSDPHLELRSEIYTGLEMGQWQAIAYGLGTADQTKHVLQSPASDFVRSMVLLLPDVLERVTGLASRVVDPSDDENNGTYEAIQELLDQLWKCQQMLHSLMESIYLTEIFPREFLYIIGSIDSAAKEFKMWEPML
jgi:ankyrin repeat protein